MHYFSYFCSKTQIVDTRQNRLAEAVLTSTYNLCFEQKYVKYQRFYLKIFCFGGEIFYIFAQACLRNGSIFLEQGCRVRTVFFFSHGLGLGKYNSPGTIWEAGHYNSQAMMWKRYITILKQQCGRRTLRFSSHDVEDGHYNSQTTMWKKDTTILKQRCGVITVNFSSKDVYLGQYFSLPMVWSQKNIILKQRYGRRTL